MSFLTQYGSFWGFIPTTHGRIFFVAPSDSYTIEGRAFSASDNNSGLSPEKALRTVGRAQELVAADVGDVVVLLPGTHTLTATLSLNKAGVTYTGLPCGKGNPLLPRTSLTGSGAIDLAAVSAARIEIAHMNIIPVTAQDAFDLAVGADGFHMHDFLLDFTTPAASTSTVGLASPGACNGILIEDFSVLCDGAQGNAFVMTATLNSIIRRGVFTLTAGTWASSIIAGAGTSGLLIADCDWRVYGTALTVAVNGTGATIASGVEVRGCRFGNLVTVPIDGFDAAECTLVGNVKAGVGAGDGGTAITAIT